MNKRIGFAALVVASLTVGPASANGLDPRMFGMMVQPLMQAVHPHHRGCDPRFGRCYRPQMGYVQQGGPHPCGTQYIPNRYGGTVVTGLPDCGRYSWQYGPQGRYWGPNGSDQMYGGGYSANRAHMRSVIIHTKRSRQVTVHGGGAQMRHDDRQPPAATQEDYELIRRVYVD